MASVIEHAQSLIDDSKPVAKAPRKPWVSDRSWNFMELLNKYRRLLAALHCDDHKAAVGAARNLIAHSGETYFPTGEQDAISGCLAAIKVLTATKRRLLREDRRRWVDEQSERADKFDSDRDARNFHVTVKQLCRNYQQRHGSRLLAPEGELVMEKSKVSAMWHQHWMKHFGASPTTAVDFEDRSTMIYDEGGPYEHSAPHDKQPVDEEICFLPADVHHAIARMPTRKASPDAVPSETWKPLSDLVAAPLASLFTDYCSCRGLPLAYAGSKVVAIWKKKGSPFLTCNYRPIALMKVEAKIMARMILQQLQRTLKFHAGQFGSGFSTGVVFPQAVIRQLAIAGREKGMATGTLFVDICAAFDKVLKPLLWGCPTTRCTEGELEKFGYSQDQSGLVLRFLSEHPAVLAACGLPAGLLAVLRVWGDHAWFVTGDTEGNPDAGQTLLGVRQGDNISALVFDVFYGHILDQLHRCLRDSDLLIELAVPVGRSFGLSDRLGRSPQPILMGPIAYRDDLAIGLWGRTNQELMEKLIRITRIVKKVHEDFHLVINFATTKTEATVSLRKPDAQSIWQGMRLVGHARGLPHPAVALDEETT
eukprot:5626062-Amphidinium_carterae.1